MVEIQEDEAKAPVFTIAGVEHEVPEVYALDFDEAQILYNYAKLTVEDFLPDEEGGKISEKQLETIVEHMKNPAYLQALRHIAYRRKNRSSSEARIKLAISGDTFAEAYVEWVLTLGGEESPPAQESTSEQTQSSESGSIDSNGSSGVSSTNGSEDHPAEIPEPTGTTRSDTSFLPSAPLTWGL